ncbi:argininosuccinate lyase [Candidatus Micrarchaeota archaeon]|nr:argininosuccinate lyase [Candidatus Micrarchaeota archaeon]
MKKMLWGGRFGEGPSADTILFNSSENIQLDAELIPYDILGSLAHVRMLYKQEIISTAEYEGISSALKSVYSQWEGDAFILRPDLEDVHMNVEAAVTAMTPAGKKMHTARSRNDQVLLDMRLYMRDRALGLILEMEGLQKAFAALSEKDGPMAAYTHTRVAQPITISFWCESWVDSLGRDIDRLKEAYGRLNANPLGACAIAGTAWKIDRKETARLLAFNSVQENALDAISSRGECEAEMLFCMSLAMCKLSRLSEELIWLSQKGLLGIAEKHTTGSSIMPNKKNPDVLELIRGRCGRVYGSLAHALIALKGTMGGYNSDMQETKYALMSGSDTTAACLQAMAGVVSGLTFNRGAIERELESGYAQATEIADFLALNGMPFREAHEKAGKLVRHCEDKGAGISALSAKEAGTVLGCAIKESDWASLKGFGRKRLNRRVTVKAPTFAREEKERIEEAYQKLV